jgi:CRISPR-associated protein Csh2
MSKVISNSDILFLYDAKLCNPNGDPDDENKPRMDYERSVNLVSDVRLKRYLRDYFQWKGQEVFVAKQDDKSVTATDRIKKLLERDKIKALSTEQIEELLNHLIDVRLFGATMPLKSEEGKGSSNTFTGPVQFNWGYSLNKTRLVDSSGITSHFSSESAMEQGTMGKDYRVYYSLIAFHGIVSAKRGEKTFLKSDDLELLDESMVKAIPLLATRSKIGQYPRLYLRLEYVDEFTFLGDLRSCLQISPNSDTLRDIKELSLDVTLLCERLIDSKQKIKKVYCWQDSQLKLEGIREHNNFAAFLTKAGFSVQTLSV